MVSAKAIRNQMVPSCVEWWCEMDSQATTLYSYCQRTAFLSVQSHCVFTQCTVFIQCIQAVKWQWQYNQMKKMPQRPSY